jgi:hypothetical protein
MKHYTTDGTPTWKPIVTPNKPLADRRPIVCLTGTEILTSDGEYFLRQNDGEPRQELAPLLEADPTVFVSDRAMPILGELNELYSDNPRFQFHLLSIPHYAFNPEWEKLGRSAHHDKYVVGRIGLYAHKRDKGKPGRWHLLLDFLEFNNGLPEDLIEGTGSRVYKMMEWARIYYQKVIREFEIPWRVTKGGVSSRILRSPHIYPRPRRKVPYATNESCRPAMRGNHYDHSRIDPKKRYENVLEVDQENAHHNAAAGIAFPYSDSLLAGYSFRHPERPAADGLSHTARHFEEVLTGKPGALLVELSVPLFPPEWFAPSYLTSEPVIIFTNEVPYLRAIGVEPRRIFATWTGEREDDGEGINAYAHWCLDILASCTERERKTIKPTLLTTYGILGSKPKALTRYFRRSDTHTETTMIPIGGRKPLRAIVAEPFDTQPFTAHVIQRGMIEAETMFRSISLANELTANGHTVLTVQADALFIRETGSIPIMLPFPWRVKSDYKYVEFPRTGAVVGMKGDGKPVSKIPGGLRKEIAHEQNSPIRVAARAPIRNARGSTEWKNQHWICHSHTPPLKIPPNYAACPECKGLTASEAERRLIRSD